jgi:hypothetical protein
VLHLAILGLWRDGNLAHDEVRLQEARIVPEMIEQQWLIVIVHHQSLLILPRVVRMRGRYEVLVIVLNYAELEARQEPSYVNEMIELLYEIDSVHERKLQLANHATLMHVQPLTIHDHDELDNVIRTI